jgi:shikimate dehydrogenase
VIGDPIAHSLSPRLHAEMLGHWQLDARYLAFHVRSEDLAAALCGMRALRIRGLNVTVPHKRAVVEYLDILDGDARELQTVNSLRLDADGTLRGGNSDAEGLELALRAAGSERPWNRSAEFAGSAWILGAGGAARAAVLAVARLGFGRICVFARQPVQAQEIVARLGPCVGRAVLEAEPLPRRGCRDDVAGRLVATAGTPDLVIQATSCGVGAQQGDSPWPVGVPLPAGSAVLDLVYGAAPSPFLRQAERAPWRADGLSMLVWQGALALQYFLGAPLPSPQTVRRWEAALRRVGEEREERGAVRGGER